MATFQSDIGAEPARAPRFGGLIARKATFTVPSGFTFGSDDIDFFKMPKDAELFDMLVTVGATGASATLDVGDSVDDDRFIAAAAQNSLTRISLVAGLNFAFASETVIKGVFNAAPSAGEVVVLRASYLLTP